MIIQKGRLLFLEAENTALVFVTHTSKIQSLFLSLRSSHEITDYDSYVYGNKVNKRNIHSQRKLPWFKG